LVVKHYFDSLDEIVSAASLISGSALGSYLAVSVGQSGVVRASSYLLLTLTFVTAIVVVMIISTLPKFLLLGLYRIAAFLALTLAITTFFLLDIASRVGVDVGVVGCAIAAWMIVPLSAWYWGRMMKREEAENG
jgi:hypothetical protein